MKTNIALIVSIVLLRCQCVAAAYVPRTTASAGAKILQKNVAPLRTPELMAVQSPLKGSRRTEPNSSKQEQQQEQGKTSALARLVSSPAGALTLLAGVVLFHESGHYVAASSMGLHPDEFSIGFGPKLLGFTAAGGDNFSLRLLPLGGYVSLPIAGLASLTWEQRVLILSAGVMFNFLLSFVVYLGQILLGPGLPMPVLRPHVLVSGIAGVNSPATGMIQAGDAIVGVQGKALGLSESPTEFEVQRTISKLITTTQNTSDGESLSITILRNNQEFEVKVTPRRIGGPDSPPSLGIFLQPDYAGVDIYQTESFGEAVVLAANTVATLVRETGIGLATFAKDLLTGKSKSSDYRVAGPVRVIQRASDVVATKDWNNVVRYIAAVSINLGVLNLFPVPPSDGFQILMTFLSLTGGS